MRSFKSEEEREQWLKSVEERREQYLERKRQWFRDDCANVLHALYQENLSYDDAMYLLASSIVKGADRAADLKVELRHSLNRIKESKKEASEKLKEAVYRVREAEAAIKVFTGEATAYKDLSFDARMHALETGKYIPGYFRIFAASVEDPYRSADAFLRQKESVIAATSKENAVETAKRGAAAKLAADPKQAAKAKIKVRWAEWQDGRLPSGVTYRTNADFARQMAAEFPVITDPNTISGWATAWSKYRKNPR